MADRQDEQEQEESVAAIGTFSKVRNAVGAGVTAATDNPVTRNLSSALMQGAFEKFGQAFTDTGFRGRRGGGGIQAGLDPNAMQPWRDAGQKAVGALEQRWMKMEYEDFQKSHVAAFSEGSSGLMEDFRTENALADEGQMVDAQGKVIQLDTTKQEDRARLVRYRSELFTKFYARQTDMVQSLTAEGVKFPHNTMIREQLMNVFETSTNQLMNTAKPQERVDTERAYSDIEVQERQVAAQERTARAQAKAAKQADRPISVKEALADPSIGVQNILPWAEDTMMNSPQAGAYIEQGKAVLADQLHAAHKAEWIAGGGKEKEYDLLDPENIAWVDSQLAQSGGAIQRAATVEFVKAKDPKAAEEAKQHSPQYYDLMGDSTAPDAPRGILSDKRITESQRDENVKGWKKPLADKLEAYMSDPNNDPDIEVAIDFIVNEWLPGAITGSTSSTAPSSIKATQSQSTEKYRELVARYARRYLEANFDKISAVAKDQNKEKARRARNLRAGKLRRRGVRGGAGLGRAISSLFGDE